tara:strand:- start:53647 stop:54510 length:864 start_codon:yes stop_codon:yes gene_type:complete
MENKNNAKYIDLLDEDKPIAGQKFTCVSFISPDKILKSKELFLFERFLKHFDFNKSMLKYQQFLNFICYKHDIDFNSAMKDYEEFIESEKNTLIETNIVDDYKNFLDARGDELDKEFNESNNFQTSVRGLKIRGSFETQQEAELRCRMLREVDPNHDIFVGPVGVWMPWDPEAYKTGKVEYLENELNELMSHKNKNEQQAKQEFETRVKENKKKAIEENIKKAQETGVKLTQTIDEQGNLIGIHGTSTIENSLLESNKPTTSADIKKELFEGDNILTSKDRDNKNSD